MKDDGKWALNEDFEREHEKELHIYQFFEEETIIYGDKIEEDVPKNDKNKESWDRDDIWTDIVGDKK